MKVSDQFIMRTIAGENILIPVGDAAISGKGLIIFSESGAFIYQKLKDGYTREEIVEALTAEYEVSADKVSKDVDAFLNQMRQLKMLAED